MGQQVNKSYCYAVEPDQGAGWHERSGAAWVRPEAGLSNITVFDDEGQAHSLVLDEDGYIYDISGRESATDSSVDQPWKDKVGTDGTGGTDIVPSVIFPWDEGEEESYYLHHLDGYIGVEPYDQTNRDETGYDSDGYPDGLQLDIELYADGHPTTYSAYSKDITSNKVINFSQEVDDAHSFYVKLTANMAQHIIKSRANYYVAADEPRGPDDTMSTEADAQGSLSAYNLAPYPVGANLINLYDGGEVSGDWTAADDPAGGENAQEMGGSDTLEDSTPTYSGDFSFPFFLYEGATFPFIVAQWTAASITVTYTGGVYYLRFNDGSNHDTALSWDGTGWVGVCVVRDGTNLNVYEGNAT